MGLIRKLILCFFLLCAIGGCAASQSPHPTRPGPAGSLYMADGSMCSPADFAWVARDYDYILLGEAHTSVCDHLMQTRLLEAMVASGMRPALGLEMVSRDHQDVLDRFNRAVTPLDAVSENGQLSLTPGTLAEAVGWGDVWGYPYSLYAPIFEAAYAARVPLYALNVPRHIVNKIRRQGLEGVPPEEKHWLPDVIIPPLPEQLEMLRRIHEQHTALRMDRDDGREARKKLLEQADVSSGTAAQGTASGQGSFGRFFLIQSLWDTVMAEQAMRVRRLHNGPVVVLAGGGHVENGWGLAHRLNILDPEARVLTVVPWRGTAPIDVKRGEYHFYCPSRHKSRFGFMLAMEEGAVLVTAVEPGSVAEKAGFAVGDVLRDVDDLPVETLWTLHKAGVKAARGESVSFGVMRGEAYLTLNIQPFMSGKERAHATGEEF